MSVMPTIMQPMYLKELYGAMLPGVKKIACRSTHAVCQPKLLKFCIFSLSRHVGSLSFTNMKSNAHLS